MSRSNAQRPARTEISSPASGSSSRVLGKQLSPALLLCLAATSLILALGISELLGLRSYMTLLSGTSPTGQAITASQPVLALVYLACYFGCLLCAPAFFFASLLLALFQMAKGKG